MRPREIVEQVNQARARYGFGPVSDEQGTVEERRCDEIAQLWVKSFGGVESWNRSLPEMVELFECEIPYRSGRIDLCGVIDTWRFDFGLSQQDFIRLADEIGAWIKTYRRRS